MVTNQCVLEVEQDSVNRLLLALEYAMRDIAIQKTRAEDAPVETRKLVEELRAFLTEHEDQGVFLLHSRLELDRLMQTYGVAE